VTCLLRFLRNPSELKNIKNISLLRQQVNAAQQPSTPLSRPSAVKMEATDYSDMPTDLSMEGPTDLSSRCPPSDLLELRWGKQQDESVKSELNID